jgi:hypothetical protein
MDSSALSSGGTISQNEAIHNIHAAMSCTAMFNNDSTQFNVVFYFTCGSIAISNIAVITG